MKAYHNDQAIKKKYLDRVSQHRAADQLIQSYGYWKDGKGCAVGCTVHSGDHAAYETELGIPKILASLEDGLFESLPVDEARLWPARFLEAIPVGADLGNVSDQFLHWLLVDEVQGVMRFAKTEKVQQVIQNVADLFARRLSGDSVASYEWRSAAYAAHAARAAAHAYAYAYAAHAARAAADADAAARAAHAARAAADAAADAYADAAYAANPAYATYAAYADFARKAASIAQSEKLIQLLSKAT